ncbi:hypothetical protein RHA1_ro10426 (plasmid) [Rhodococcus jostii RHA1]|uniref:Uncharacterized protein n=1 Tax=Rhodococcus jostii (strain RHA1) TaxID=101510 RepID=Q0RVS1_RHOJR|nr:hypothetical protein RHA1_ro10426 [Rhodococcus jostii RHA1]
MLVDCDHWNSWMRDVDIDAGVGEEEGRHGTTHVGTVGSATWCVTSGRTSATQVCCPSGCSARRMSPGRPDIQRPGTVTGSLDLSNMQLEIH